MATTLASAIPTLARERKNFEAENERGETLKGEIKCVLGMNKGM
jgi:hypothetical protein